MLFHLPITKVYLNRRSRLFQTYQSHPLFELPDASSEGPMLETQRWLCKFGQVLESERISIKQVKTIIFSASSQQIFSIRNEVAQIIRLAIHCHPASKISNIMYYLCRRSPPFRKTLIKQLAKMCEMLPKIKSHQFQHKICIILTDMFLFGIYFTQNQFVQQILSIISYDQRHGDSPSEELIQFRLFYLCHYCQILSLPLILLQKNYRKFLSILQQCLKQTCSYQLQKSLQCVKQSLQNIQKSYSTGLKRQEYKQQQRQLLNLIHNYEEKRMAISKTIITVTDFSQYRNRKQVNRQTDIEGLLKKVQVDYPSLLSFGNQHTEDQNKMLEGEDRDEAESLDSGSSSSKNEEIQNEQAKAEQKLLCTVYNNCKNYKNKQIYTQDHIYILPKVVSMSPTQTHTYLQQLPQQYLVSLQNCADMETSTNLADTFLRDYNKHGNRAKLVYSIMKQLYQRNNLVFIVRVLAMVYKTEKKEIDELIKQQVDVIREKCAGKIGKSQYGRYGDVIVEMNKFDMVDTEAYLTGLLHLVSQMANRSPQRQPLLQASIFHPLYNFNQPITFQQLLPLLQKLDRDIYYKSLPCHIIFNQIIQVVRNHIKNRKVGYDFQIVNRFNGLVNYLQEVRLCRQHQLECKEIISAQSLKENRVFRETVRKFQDELGRFGKKEALNKIVRILVDSIQSQNYIDSYLYADLVYQTNSRKLDTDIKQAAIRQILQGLNNGNYQGAANWSRFYGQLHRYKVISQNELIVLLQDILLNAWFQTCPAPATKVICSALDTCWHYMKSTKKISQINETLKFLLHTKHQLLKSGGLKNTILEYEIEQILENIHTSFKYIRSVQDCLFIEKQIERNGDLELVLNDYELMCNRKQMENQRTMAVASRDVAVQEGDKSVNVKYVQRQKQEMKLMFKLKESVEKVRSKSPQQMEGQATKLNMLQLTQLQTNSSQHETEKNLHSCEKQSRECIKQQEKQVKKMKVIGRMKNGRKIEKIEITK